MPTADEEGRGLRYCIELQADPRKRRSSRSEDAAPSSEQRGHLLGIRQASEDGDAEGSSRAGGTECQPDGHRWADAGSLGTPIASAAKEKGGEDVVRSLLLKGANPERWGNEDVARVLRESTKKEERGLGELTVN